MQRSRLLPQRQIGTAAIEVIIMSVPLPDQTYALLDACLADGVQRRRIGARLERELPDGLDPELLERIRFSVIRLILANHERDYENVAFELAKKDWRDLLMAAGHGETTDHKAWAAEVLMTKPRLSLSETPPMEANVDVNGWVKCPKCHFRFRLSDPNAWDGAHHRRCLQPLHIRTE